MSSYNTLVVTLKISASKLDKLRGAFTVVHYHPDGQVPPGSANAANAWYTGWLGLPKQFTTLEQVPNLRMVQLSSAGANDFLRTDVMKSEAARKQIQVCSASGIHVVAIPQYIIANIINLYMMLHTQIYLARKDAVCPTLVEIGRVVGQKDGPPPCRTLSGKTVGFLGYGHIARETARLLTAFNCRILAASSNGQRRPEKGYRMANTGDEDCSLPVRMYSSSDPQSLGEFLESCDVLIASLPSTPQTRYMLNEQHLRRLRKGAVFVNVGRGDLIKADDIVAALEGDDSPLAGVVLDVTDPEPLPQGHPLFKHPMAIVTPHSSGYFEGYYDAGADVLLMQAERMKKGLPLVNAVDPDKGY